MLEKYFAIRAQETNRVGLDDFIQATAEILQQKLMQRFNDIQEVLMRKIEHSSLTYVPQYKRQSGSEAFINCHTDRSTNYHYREVECLAGSGTVLFADNDFKVATLSDARGYDAELQQINNQVVCWTAPSKSSVIIRVSTELDRTQGTRPAAHSHGVGRDDFQPEERLTIRYDLNL